MEKTLTQKSRSNWRSNNLARPRNDDLAHLPPNSPEAERGVLGCVLLSPTDCLDQAIEYGLSPDWFYDLRHRVVWTAMTLTPGLDTVTLSSYLNQHEPAADGGWLVFVSKLPNDVPSSANLVYYLDILKEKWLSRKLLLLAGETEEKIRNGSQPPQEVALWSQGELARLSDDRTQSEINIKEAARTELNKMDEYHRGGAQMTGLSTGLSYVDKLLCGIGGENGFYFVLSGRPGMGKTSLALQIALHVALDYVWFEPVTENGQPVMEGDKPKTTSHKGIPVAIFSLEMVTGALVKRMLFQRAQADLQRWRTGFAESQDVAALIAANHELARLGNIWIDDTPRQSIDAIRARARRLKRQHGIKLFILDYVQLLRGDGRQDRVQELSKISAEIVALGKELLTPWLVLAQMNRDFEKEPTRRPRLSDLKDCGGIEQDADQVGFLYPPKLRDKESEQYEALMEKKFAGGDWSKRPKRVDLLFAKNRYGPDGNCQLLFQKSCTRFLDWNDYLSEGKTV